jgi:fused signal recognition particle receptor
MNENLITKWRKGLEKTRKVTFGRIANFLGTSEINDETWDELETLLIQSDIGAEISLDIVSRLQQAVHERGLTQQVELAEQLKEELFSRVDRPDIPILHTKPFIILLVGVNGSGKTTSAAKLANRFKNKGKAVMLVAADTYRAAAIDQLKIWADRVQVPVIAGQQGGDPGASVFDGIKAAESRESDVVIIDTAGRLHTRYNLMEEIKKVHRVCGKAFPGAPHATWLVLDATTGQNALQQAKSFQKAVKVDGVILAKLDMSAKGGMAIAIKEKLGLPILFAGLGEGIEDLQLFDQEAFINGIVN